MLAELYLVASLWTQASASPSPGVDYVLRLHQVIPDLFSQAPDHEVDLAWLARLREQMKEDAAAPRELLSIRVSVPSARRAVTRSVSEASFARANEAYRELRDAEGLGGSDAGARLLARASELIEAASGQTFEGWLARRLSSAAETERRRVFRLPLPELFAEIPEAQLRYENQERLIGLLRFAIWSDGYRDGHRPAANLVSADRRAFLEDPEFEARFRHLRHALGATGRKDRARLNLLNALKRRARDEIASPAPADDDDAHDHVTLEELPSEFGLARSFLGHDCSTPACAASAFAPSERIFAVLDAKAYVRGYVAISRVKRNEGPVIYVHTINGRRIGTAQARLILNGLRVALPRLAGDALVVPTESRVAENMNSPEVRDVFRDLSRDRPMVEWNFLDVEARRELEKRFARDYDVMAKNSAGHDVTANLPSGETSKIVVNVEPSSRYGQVDPREYSRIDFLGAVVRFVAAGRDDMGRSLWRLAGEPEPDFERLRGTVWNEMRWPRAEYHRRMETLWEETGHAGESVPAELLEVGDLVAADALARPEETRVRLLDAVAQGRVGPSASVLNPSRISVLWDSLRTWDGIWWRALLKDATDRIRRDPDPARSRRDPSTEARRLGRLVGRMISSKDLIQRADGLAAAGLSWTTLEVAATAAASAFFSLDGMGDRAIIEALGEKALRTSTTIEDYLLRLDEIGSSEENLETRLRSRRSAVARTLSHLASFSADEAHSERLTGALGMSLPWAHVLAWEKSAAPGTVNLGNFPGLSNAHDDKEAAAFLISLIESRLQSSHHVATTFEELLELRRRLPILKYSALTFAFAVRNLVRNLEDLSELLVVPEEGTEIATRLLLDHLPEALILWKAADPGAQRSFLETRREQYPALDALLAREEAFVRAESAEDMLAAVRNFPIDAAEAKELFSNSGTYVPMPRLRQFLNFGPTPTQFREFTETTEEVLGRLRLGAELVHSLENLRTLMRPMNTPSVTPTFAAVETLALVRAVVARPGSFEFLTEKHLDELMDERGLSSLRGGIPRLATCAEALGEG